MDDFVSGMLEEPGCGCFVAIFLIVSFIAVIWAAIMINVWWGWLLLIPMAIGLLVGTVALLKHIFD